MLCKSKLNNEDKYESNSKFYIFSLRYIYSDRKLMERSLMSLIFFIFKMLIIPEALKISKPSCFTILEFVLIKVIMRFLYVNLVVKYYSFT